MVNAFMLKRLIVILGGVVQSFGHGTLVHGCIHFWSTKLRKFWYNLGFMMPNVWYFALLYLGATVAQICK